MMAPGNHERQEVHVRGVALASGSNGNAVYVETPDARLLFDAGTSGRRIEARARSREVSLRGVDALLLTHGHHDHVAGAGVLARRFGLPVYATGPTWARIDRKAGRVAVRRTFRPSDTLRFGRTAVHAMPTPHDIVGSVAFVVEHEGVRLGVLTDLGHGFPALEEELASLDGAFLEANFDERMLAQGPYPPFLQDRIAGPGGHLSNGESVALVSRCAGRRLRALVLAHLSGNCNTAAHVRAAAAPIAARGVDVEVASRDAPSQWLDLGRD